MKLKDFEISKNSYCPDSNYLDLTVAFMFATVAPEEKGRMTVVLKH